MRILASLAMAILLGSGSVPTKAGAEPLILDLRPGRQTLEKKELAALVRLLEELEKAWTQQPADSLNLLLDREWGREFWRALHSDSLRYGDYLRAAMADSEGYDAFQTRVWRRLRSGRHELLGFNSRRASLFRCGSGKSKLVGLGKFASIMDIENMERHPEHPLLGKILVLSLLTPLDWSVPDFKPWREAEESVSSLPWEDFKADGDLGASPGRELHGKKAIDAHVDSIFKSDPDVKELGWLQKHLLKKVMKMALTEMDQMQQALQEYQAQKTGLGEPGAPPCPLFGHAVMRLVFLRDEAASSRWRLVLCLPSSLQDHDIFPLYTEPGFADWYDRLNRWRKRDD